MLIIYVVFVKYLIKNGNIIGAVRQLLMDVPIASDAVGMVISYNILMEFCIPPLHLPVGEVQLSKEEFGVSVQLVKLIK
jgi:hypothetical protein